MTASNLVFPMAALVLLTFGVVLKLFRSRVRAVREGQASASYFRTYSSGTEPELSAKAARHFTNLFEAPVLFYVVCLAAMIVGPRGNGMVILAWLYVAARYAHAFVHLGANRLRHRIAAYMASWVFLIWMWVNLVVHVATQGR